MRWDNLFDDLEGQLEQGMTADEVDLRAEEERLRLARLGMRDRILAITRTADEGLPPGGSTPEEMRTLHLVLRDGGRLTVSATTCGRDWLAGELTESRRRRACVIPIEAIAGLALSNAQITASLEPADRPDDRSLSARLGIGFVLRDICRRRASVEVRLVGEVVHGTIDRVGRDHCDIAIHEPGGVRRESDVTEHRLIALGQVLVVRL